MCLFVVTRPEIPDILCKIFAKPLFSHVSCHLSIAHTVKSDLVKVQSGRKIGSSLSRVGDYAS